ncbi:MAG: DUF4367 domain-containing protein [Erysipelotrichaceae bacterium]|nr:DUF4367 domain-containing protein [Erysipelotrichaceae bacterium]
MTDFYDFTDYPFTKEDLRRACAAYASDLVASVEGFPDPEFEPSASHRAAIRRMIDRSYRKGRRHAFYRRAAAIAAVFVILFSTILATNVHAREAVVRWLRQIFPDHVLYQFFGEPVDELQQYTISWIPEGFELVDQFEVDGYRMYSYESEDEGFSVSFAVIEDGLTIEIGDAAFEMRDVIVNGRPATLFVDVDDSSKNLIWISEDNNVEIDIEGNISVDMLMRIAESINYF